MAPFVVQIERIGLSLVVAVGVEELANGSEEVGGRSGWGNSAGEDGLIGDVLAAVVGLGVVSVLMNDVASEIEACEDALAAGVGEEGGVRGVGGGGLRVTSDGTGGYGGVRTELELVVEEALKGVVGGADENEVSGLSTDLKAEAGSGELDEGRCAPAVAGAAGDHALAVLSAYDECTFFEAGDDGDACGFGGDIVGDTFVGCGHEFVEDGVSGIDTLIKLCRVRGGI